MMIRFKITRCNLIKPILKPLYTPHIHVVINITEIIYPKQHFRTAVPKLVDHSSPIKLNWQEISKKLVATWSIMLLSGKEGAFSLTWGSLWRGLSQRLENNVKKWGENPTSYFHSKTGKSGKNPFLLAAVQSHCCPPSCPCKDLQGSQSLGRIHPYRTLGTTILRYRVFFLLHFLSSH